DSSIPWAELLQTLLDGHPEHDVFFSIPQVCKIPLLNVFPHTVLPLCDLFLQYSSSCPVGCDPRPRLPAPVSHIGTEPFSHRPDSAQRLLVAVLVVHYVPAPGPL